MAISMADIKHLRTMTGAGMMDCKNALTEANGDIEKAIEVIRKKGQAFAAKREDRDASEGCVLSATVEGYGALVAIKCETDFVAINADFVGMTKTVLENALKNKPADAEALLNMEIEGRKVSDVIVDRSGITGEKMELGVFESIEAPMVVAYIHPGNKLATLVGFNKAGVDAQVAKDIAMQVAAMSPVALTKEDVPADIVARELEIGKEKAREEGKPEAMLDKIAQGRLGKFFKESTLLQQDFIKESKISVAQYLANQDKELQVVAFKRFTLNAE